MCLNAVLILRIVIVPYVFRVKNQYHTETRGNDGIKDLKKSKYFVNFHELRAPAGLRSSLQYRSNERESFKEKKNKQ